MTLEYVEIPGKYSKRRDILDREHLARVSHAKKRRNHPKRHATNQERSHEDRARHLKETHVKKLQMAARKAWQEKASAYWLGLSVHP